MLESLIIDEFKEKDYTIFEQQILEMDISPSELQSTLERILETKSKSLREKITLLLQEGKRSLLETAFNRARKRYKRNMAFQ